ncbi:MAG: hypothetical protein COT74_12630 [Bdellovibrionales bacterium CG10_big_fil_rev_8_21_14_0_10_45_34]|nr:MAG: hypothetical protein COT74_12630 [Bdellovibrionales bacterium CG10_big_fil_rev_8_21_14_0_10_45_34]
MRSFSKKYLERLELPLGTMWLLGECMEFKGKQQLWESRRPEVLSALKEIAIIQSVESSNRIEGVEVESKRLRPLVLGNSRPRTRSEEEIMGYRRALELVHLKHSNIQVRPKTIQQLHNRAQEGAGDAGQWKSSNNEIIEFDSKGLRSVRFIPTSAKLTPKQMDQLCLGYAEESQKDRLPSLVLSALFVLDFLCIHPFRDGNGRVSRLLTLLLTYKNDFHVGRYISFERIIEENKIEYYQALKLSSQGWHQSKHDAVAWLNFFLSTIRMAYKELSEKVSGTDVESGGKTEIIKKAILEEIGLFSLKDIQTRCPSVSQQMIKKVLADLKKKQLIELRGRGRGAKWHVK